MVDEKIKKILIFAMPRSGTTVIQQIIATHLFQLPNLVEPFSDPKLGFDSSNPKIINGQPADLYRWTQDQPMGVIKLLAVNLNYVDVGKLLSMGNFNRVVVVERKNLVDCCISLCLAEKTFKYHYYRGESPGIESFECDAKFVNNWIYRYRQYLAALTQIKKSSVPYDTIIYEDFMSNKIQYIADVPLQGSTMSNKLFRGDKKMVSLELSYQDLCINYHEIKEKIRKELC